MRLNIDLHRIFHQGVSFLLNENAKGYPEAVHYLTLPVGRAGRVVYQTYPAWLFPRMLILDSLLDCADFDQRITKKLTETEIVAFLQAKHPDVVGGWSYIPILRELPPDVDDLGMVLQLLARTGGKQLASLCNEAIDVVFKYGSYPDGAIETWVVDPSDRSLAADAMRAYIQVIGGRGVSPEVVANLLWGLALYDPERYRYQIAAGARYLTSSQMDEGFWPSKWYWGKYYGTYRALTFLAAFYSTSESIERAQRFLCDSRLPDGGWGETNSEPLSTALGLLSLLATPGCKKEKRQAASWLAAAQSVNGSWEGSPFIKLATKDGDLTYASKTITTAFCLQALTKALLADPALAVLPIDSTELPYRRDIGKLSISSDQNGQWELVKGHELRQQNCVSLTGQACFSDSFANRLPALHIIELTDRCNLTCTYCAASARRGALSQIDGEERHEVMGKIADFILASSPANVCVEFQGGETLLNFPAMQYFVEAITTRALGSGKQVNFRMVSNLTMLTPRVADQIAAWPMTVTTSLDGIQTIHDKHRTQGNQGSGYIRVVQAIGELRRRHVNVGTLMVVTRDALAQPEEIVDNFAELALYRFGLNPVAPLGDAEKNWNAIGLEPTTYSYFWQSVLRRCLAHQARGTPIWDRTSEILVRKIMLAQDPGFVDLASPCGCVRGQIAYDLQGNIYPCDEARLSGQIVLGNVHHTYEDILLHPETVALRQASLITEERCGTCAYRPWCGRCPVVNRLRFGREDVPSEVTYQCQIWKGIFDRFFELLDEEPDAMRHFAVKVEAYG